MVPDHKRRTILLCLKVSLFGSKDFLVYFCYGSNSEIMNKEAVKGLYDRLEVLNDERDTILKLLGIWDAKKPVAQQKQRKIITVPIVADARPIEKSAADLHDGVPAKGNISWEDYTYLALQLVGGKGKKDKVADPVVISNPDIPEKTVRSAISHWLVKLAQKGKIKATRGVSLKEGNYYELIE